MKHEFVITIQCVLFLAMGKDIFKISVKHTLITLT